MSLEHIETSIDAERTSFSWTGVGTRSRTCLVLGDNMAFQVFLVSKVFLAVLAGFALSSTSLMAVESTLSRERLPTTCVGTLEPLTLICVEGYVVSGV